MSMAATIEREAVEKFSASLLKALDALLEAGDDQVLTYEVKNTRSRVIVCTATKFREVLKDARAKAQGVVLVEDFEEMKQ